MWMNSVTLTVTLADITQHHKYLINVTISSSSSSLVIYNIPTSAAVTRIIDSLWPSSVVKAVNAGYLSFCNR